MNEEVNEDGVSRALTTLRELQSGAVLSQTDAALTKVIERVLAVRKGGAVLITIAVEPMGEMSGLVQPPITFRASVTTKLPELPAPTDIFFVDLNGHPTKTMETRQRPLDIVVQPINRGNG